MTTREPDDSMIEIAVAAMQPIIAREDREFALARGESVPDVDTAHSDDDIESTEESSLT